MPPTEEQVHRIATLLDATDLDREDLSFEDERWAIYERVSSSDADEIIEWLLDVKEMRV